MRTLKLRKLMNGAITQFAFSGQVPERGSVMVQAAPSAFRPVSTSSAGEKEEWISR